MYTDESAINKKVGAAVVASTEAFTLWLFLGAASFYTLYLAELGGILGALHLALARPQSDNCQRVVTFTDNQAAICTLGKLKRESGQIIVIDILQVIGLLRSKNIQIELHRVPAHPEIQVDGKEEADNAIKESTGWRLIKHRNNRVVEKDANKTAAKVLDLPLKRQSKQCIDDR